MRAGKKTRPIDASGRTGRPLVGRDKVEVCGAVRRPPVAAPVSKWAAAARSVGPTCAAVGRRRGGAAATGRRPSATPWPSRRRRGPDRRNGRPPTTAGRPRLDLVVVFFPSISWRPTRDTRIVFVSLVSTNEQDAS